MTPGGTWVVLSINVCFFGEGWALLVLFRFYRSKTGRQKERRPYRKTTELCRLVRGSAPSPTRHAATRRVMST